MARVVNRGPWRLAWAVGAAALVAITAVAPARAEEPRSYVVRDFGVMPRPSVREVLLEQGPIQEAIGINDAQKAAIQGGREADLDAKQAGRLDQIQLQLQGPLAFLGQEFGPRFRVGAPIPERLKLSDDQAKRVREIAESGLEAIHKAASVPIELEDEGGTPTVEAIRTLVQGPKFRAAKAGAIRAGREAWDGVMRRIEGVLTDAQREQYRRLLGEPFDVAALRPRGEDEVRDDMSIVGAAFGLAGQRADPDFDTKVARPAYGEASRRPRVLFDEAHHNFHTAGGRYKPFAELIANDGYRVVPNRAPFSRDTLRDAEVLIIANALGAEGMGQPGASESAFTVAECDAVRAWVEGGGSLLLITDHAPMGAAASRLARRLGVDLSQGAVTDPKNSEENDSSLVFSADNRLLGDHPITRGRDDSERVRRVRTFTGTSMTGPEGSVAILKLGETAVDHPPGGPEPVPAAGRAQGLAFRLGKGRVVVLGEAAQLSAQVAGLPGQKFGMNVPGLDNRQLALNLMHWLSGLLEPGDAGAKDPGRRRPPSPTGGPPGA